MTIYCRICNHPIQSQTGDQVKDVQKVLEGISNHLRHTHKTEAEALSNDMQLLPLVLNTYLMIKRFVRCPDHEILFRRSFEDNEQWLLALFTPEPVTGNSN